MLAVAFNFCSVPEGNCVKRLIQSTFVKKINKKTQCQILLFFCYFRFNILHATMFAGWNVIFFLFSFHLVLLFTPGWDSGVLRLVLSNQ